MITIRVFFLQIRELFSNFRKRGRGDLPPLPPLVTRLDWMLVLQKRTGRVNVWLVLNGCWPSKKDIHRKNRILCWLSWFSKDLFANLLISAKNFVVPPCNDYYYYYYLLLTTYYLLLTTYYLLLLLLLLQNWECYEIPYHCARKWNFHFFVINAFSM